MAAQGTTHLVTSETTVTQREDLTDVIRHDTVDYRDCIINAVKEMMTMPYIKNSKNDCEHERAVANVLMKHGFHKGELPRSIKKKNNALKWFKEPGLASEVPNGTYIEQPLGRQASPDLIVKVSDKFVLFIECKSSKYTFPKYNSGGVKKDYLYVFCSEKSNQTTIYKGSSVITTEVLTLIEDYIKEARERDEVFNSKLKELDFKHRGFCYYTRPMINQQGGKTYSNYFTHESRREVEEYALNWVKELCEL